MDCALALLGPLAPGPVASLERLKQAFTEVVLCADQPLDHLALELTTIRPLAGPAPLGAILAALLLTTCERIVVSPLPSDEMLEQLSRLAAFDPEAEVVLLQPTLLVPGRFGRGCRRPLERALGRGQGMEGLRGLRVAVLDA